MIAELGLLDLGPGVLNSLFREGAGVVLLDLGDRTRDIWRRLVQNTPELLPWQLPLHEVAANHHGSPDITKALGDVLYFQPGLHGYFARKIELEKTLNGDLQANPADFFQNGARISPDHVALAECWSIAEQIMVALAPKDHDLASYRVAVQRLKYQSSPSHFQMLSSLTSNSLARWGRLGFRIDQNRGLLPPKLAGKWISDVFGLLMMMPLGRSLANWAAARATTIAPESAPASSAIVERQHTDHRYFSALCGERPSVETEFLFGDAWHKVPVSIDKLAIFPGELARRDFGLNPVIHRVIYPPADSGRPEVDVKSGDVTLLLGAN